MPLGTQQNGSGFARRILLAVFLVASLALVTLYAREGQDGPVHAVQNTVMGVTGTVGSVGAGIGAATEAAGNAAQDATANPNTLTGLREQNEELRSLLASAEEYRQEVERLQGLLEMKKNSGVTGPTAHIIGRSVNAWDQSITIDLGSADEVQAGMTVMGTGGVIGQVSHTSAHTSTVRLLTDPNSGAAAMVQSSRANGIVRGSINALLYLEDLDEDVIPAVGDVVVTSGLGGSYERGLLIGTVVSVNKTETDTTGDIIVSPNADASMLEEVIVVFTAPDAAAQEKKQSDEAAAKKAEQEASQAAEQAESDAAAEDEGDGAYVEEAPADDAAAQDVAADGYAAEGAGDEQAATGAVA